MALVGLRQDVLGRNERLWNVEGKVLNHRAQRIALYISDIDIVYAFSLT